MQCKGFLLIGSLLIGLAVAPMPLFYMSPDIKFSKHIYVKYLYIISSDWDLLE